MIQKISCREKNIMSQKKSCSTKFFFGKSPDEIFFWKKLRKLAKCRALTSAFGGSIPGGWAGVFRRKTLEKRRKCSCDSVTCSKPSAKRENVGVWGHSPQEKFAVSNVCVVSFAERVFASLRLRRVLWLFDACARTPVVLCTSPPRASPRRERSDRRVGSSGRRPPDPKGSPEPRQ